MSFLCPSCGKISEDHHNFCTGCGMKLNFKHFCKKCGNPYEYTQSFCIKCGSPIDTSEHDSKVNEKWRLFPVSIILYITILLVHLIFMVVFKEHFIKNMPIVSIFDSLMIIIWACFPAYNTFKIFLPSINFFYNIYNIHVIEKNRYQCL